MVKRFEMMKWFSEPKKSRKYQEKAQQMLGFFLCSSM